MTKPSNQKAQSTAVRLVFEGRSPTSSQSYLRLQGDVPESWPNSLQNLPNGPGNLIAPHCASPNLPMTAGSWPCSSLLHRISRWEHPECGRDMSRCAHHVVLRTAWPDRDGSLSRDMLLERNAQCKVGLAKEGHAHSWPKSVKELAKVGLARVDLAKIGHDQNVVVDAEHRKKSIVDDTLRSSVHPTAFWVPPALSCSVSFTLKTLVRTSVFRLVLSSTCSDATLVSMALTFCVKGDPIQQQFRTAVIQCVQHGRWQTPGTTFSASARDLSCPHPRCTMCCSVVKDFEETATPARTD